MPIVGAQPRKKGIGLVDSYNVIDDVNTLNAAWFYDWAFTSSYMSDIRYVPMSFSGNDPNLPDSYTGPLLVFNEPDNSGQANLAPEIAVNRYAKLLSKYNSKNKLIVGGWMYWERGWLDGFLSQLTKQGVPMPTNWHCHGYVEWTATVDKVLSFWDACHQKTGGTYWISEFGDPNGDTEIYKTMLAWLDVTPWIERYSAFANRMDGTESWYPSFWPNPPKMAMISPNGNITELGDLYKDDSSLY